MTAIAFTPLPSRGPRWGLCRAPLFVQMAFMAAECKGGARCKGGTDLELEIDVDKVCYLIAKSREFESPLGAVEGDLSENRPDEPVHDVHTADEGDATFDEVKSWFEVLNWDDQCQIVALAWVGRGDYAKEDLAEAVRAANQQHNDRTAEYLLGMPLLADYLEEALTQLGHDVNTP